MPNDGAGAKTEDTSIEEKPVKAVPEKKPEVEAKASQSFTLEQVEKMVSDKVAAKGWDAKKLEERTKALEEKEKSLKTWEEKRIQSDRDAELKELEGAKDNPELLSVIQRKQKLAADIRAHNAEVDRFNQEKQSQEQAIAEAQEIKFELAIFDLASKHNIDANILKDKAEKTGLKDVSKLEEIAAVMPKKTDTPKPDPGGMTGGGIDLSNLSWEEKIKYGLTHPKR